MAYTLTMVSGDGQVVSRGSFWEPLIVQLMDGATPVVGAVVTWTVDSGWWSMYPSTSITDSNGLAEHLYSGDPLINSAQSWLDAAVTASTPGASDVVFHCITTTITIPGFAVWPTVDIITPSTIIGWAGNPSSTITNGLQLTVVATSGADKGHGIPNVAVWIDSGDPLTVPTASLPGGTAYTTESGLTSDVDLGAVTGGPVWVTIRVGGFAGFGVPLRVAGSIAATTAHQSEYQYAMPSAAFDYPLVVKVTLADGSPSVGTAVVWAVVTPGSLTINSSGATTDSQGLANASITAGAATGTYQITATADGNTATFYLTIDDPAATQHIEKVSGSSQSAVAGAAFHDPLRVWVFDGSTVGVSGVTVTFTVDSGSVALSAGTAVTNAGGYASVTATAGLHTGAARVTASIPAGASTSFTLTVTSSTEPPGDDYSGGGGVVGTDTTSSAISGLRLVGYLGVTLSNPPDGGWDPWVPEVVPVDTEADCLAEFDKHPADVMDVSLDWEPWLAGDMIVSSAWDGDGLAVNTSSSTTTTSTVNLSGGIQDQVYAPKNTIVTSAGRTEVRRIRISVKVASVDTPIQVGWTRETPS